jgi:hypothetical protein
MTDNIAPIDGAFCIEDTSKETFYESLVNLQEMNPNQLDILAKEASNVSRKKRRQSVKDSGRIPKKYITAQQCADNLVHMLNNKATVEETIAFASEGKPEGWFDSVKNDELSRYTRKSVSNKLKEKDDKDTLPMLRHMIDNDYISFREIQKYDTHNNQLKQFSKLITMSDRISELECQVVQLNNFKDRQLLFNDLVVSQMEYQQDKVIRLEGSVSILSKKDRMVEYQKRLNQISSEISKIEYLLSVDLTKMEISKILDIPYRTLMRKLKKLECPHK